MPENPTTGPIDIASLTFEDALAELEKIVRQIEDGRSRLDDAIQAYERGVALKRHCDGKLKEAQAKIELISMNDGAISTTPFGARG